MTLQKSTIFLRDYLYTTLSGTNVEYKSLCYKELENIQSKYAYKRNQHKIFIIKASLVNKEDFYKLNSDDITTLSSNILETSYITNKDMEEIKNSVGIFMEDTFKDDTFKDCRLCQERGLDKQRNCPLLDSNTHDRMVFYIVDDAKVNICPMDSANSTMVADAFRCHSLFVNGFMPTEGGLYDQSMFFVESSLLVKNVIDRGQAEAMKKNK